MADETQGKKVPGEPGDPTEGVRIIGADEAAEAMERGDVAARRGGDQPRYGDRPKPPPVGPKPALRFPLDADPSDIDRPAVRPVRDPDYPAPVTGGQRFDPMTDDDGSDSGYDDGFDVTGEIEAEDVQEPEVAPSLFDRPGPGQPEAEPELDDTREDAVPSAWEAFRSSGASTEAEERGRPSWADDDSAPPTWADDDQWEDADVPVPSGPAADGSDDRAGAGPLIGPGEGPSAELPHWTEPATGEVPRVVIGEDDEDDLEAWSSFSAGAPRWRDTDTTRDWEQDTGFHEVISDDDSWRVGAMDDARPAPGDEFSFDDLEEVARDRRTASGRVPVVGGTAGDELSRFDRDDDADLDASPGVPDFDVDEDLDEVSPVGARVRGGATAGPDRRSPEGGPPARRTPPPRPNPSVAEYAGGKGAGRDVGTAVGVGVGIAAVALVIFAVGSFAVAALAAVILGLCAIEYLNAVHRAGYQPANLLGLVASVAFPLAVYWRGIAAYPVLLAVLLVAALCWHLVGADGDARVVESVGVTVVGVLWVGGMGSFATLLLREPDGRGMLLAAVIATVAYDVGGFAIGRSAGTRPLSAASPNKTVEGLVAGMASAVVVTAVVVGGLPGIAPFDDFGAAALVGLAAALVAPLGDLCESLVKRDLGIKDMGSLIPAHGGAFDRFDALLFVLPAVWFAATTFSLGPWG